MSHYTTSRNNNLLVLLAKWHQQDPGCVCKTVISLALVSYSIIIYHLISNALSWDNCPLFKQTLITCHYTPARTIIQTSCSLLKTSQNLTITSICLNAVVGWLSKSQWASSVSQSLSNFLLLLLLLLFSYWPDSLMVLTDWLSDWWVFVRLQIKNIYITATFGKLQLIASNLEVMDSQISAIQ